MSERWDPPDLTGRVALVTGASRGVGRGVAEVLAECGAKVYLVSRSAEGVAPGRTGTLADVGESISSRGGQAVVAPCDLSDDEAIDALVERVTEEDGHLDVLVNNAVAWNNSQGEDDLGNPDWMYRPPWHAPRSWWNDNFDVGVRSHWVLTNAFARLLTKNGASAVFFTSELQPDEPGMQELVLDLRATVVQRMAQLFALHFRPRGVSSILFYPGFTRTDAIERAWAERGKYFEGWTEDEYRAKTASILYAGRAVASLAADPKLLDKTGSIVQSQDAGAEYGFTDTDGTQLVPL